jgi:F-type H+-transporting ATPase subunit delta
MLNPRLAGRYAKSLIDLSLERGQLEEVYKDMIYLNAVCTVSREFVNVLKSPVISPDKKVQILEAVTGGKIGELSASFIKLLIKKGRETFLPEIVSAFIDQYKDHEGIYVVKLTTAAPVSEELKKAIVNKIQTQTVMKQVELNTEVNEGIIGGFILEVGDHLVDASIAFELNNARKQFQDNDFVYKVR